MPGRTSVVLFRPAALIVSCAPPVILDVMTYAGR
jgi:hypothetical protein